MNPSGHIRVTDVSYTVDGHTMTGRLALPPGAGPFPGVLIAHEGPGLDEFQLGRPERLAAHGYAAFALDYHGEAAPFADRESMFARLADLHDNPETIRALAQVGLDQLISHDAVDPARVAALGYCFGGEVVLELARSGADVALTVGYHPSLDTKRPADNANITGHVAIFVGADDPFIDAAQRSRFEADMRAAAARYQMTIYGGVVHSFTHPFADAAALSGIAYDRRADEHSWNSTLALLDDTIGSEAR